MAEIIEVIKIDMSVGDFRVTGRVEVETTSGPDDPMVGAKRKSLAARIERAVTSALVNFRDDFSIPDGKVSAAALSSIPKEQP